MVPLPGRRRSFAPGLGACGFYQLHPFDTSPSGLLCRSDADCARSATCEGDGFCGGEACLSDADCEAMMGTSAGACVRNDCPASPGNYCTLICSYEP
jgi:hypothetical protein